MARILPDRWIHVSNRSNDLRKDGTGAAPQVTEIKINQFRRAIVFHQYVGWFEVAMHNIVGVSMRQSLADFTEEREPLVNGKWVLGEVLRNTEAWHQLHT